MAQQCDSGDSSLLYSTAKTPAEKLAVLRDCLIIWNDIVCKLLDSASAGETLSFKLIMLKRMAIAAHFPQVVDADGYETVFFYNYYPCCQDNKAMLPLSQLMSRSARANICDNCLLWPDTGTAYACEYLADSPYRAAKSNSFSSLQDQIAAARSMVALIHERIYYWKAMADMASVKASYSNSSRQDSI